MICNKILKIPILCVSIIELSFFTFAIFQPNIFEDLSFPFVYGLICDPQLPAIFQSIIQTLETPQIGLHPLHNTYLDSIFFIFTTLQWQTRLKTNCSSDNQNHEKNYSSFFFLLIDLYGGCCMYFLAMICSWDVDVDSCILDEWLESWCESDFFIFWVQVEYLDFGFTLLSSW